jgi:RNA polymerase sigma factor FliA
VNPGVRAYADAQPAADLDELVRKHADLVKRIAYHLAGRLPPQVEIADLMQAGMMGLLEAATHYSSGRGASFETYAGIRIRGAMLDALRKLDWAPRSVHRKARAAQMGVPLTEYQQILRDALGCQLLRLNDAEEGEDSQLDRLPDGSPDPEGLALEESRRRALAAAVLELPERERLVLSLYYEQELNLKEIGAVLKVTESRVCQLHGQALLRLKALLAEWYH